MSKNKRLTIAMCPTCKSLECWRIERWPVKISGKWSTLYCLSCLTCSGKRFRKTEPKKDPKTEPNTEPKADQKKK